MDRSAVSARRNLCFFETGQLHRTKTYTCLLLSFFLFLCVYTRVSILVFRTTGIALKDTIYCVTGKEGAHECAVEIVLVGRGTAFRKCEGELAVLQLPVTTCNYL